MSTIVYLVVPYSEKDEAKALGARWDPESRKWYVPIGQDKAPFKRWMTGDKSKITCYALGSLDVVHSFEKCWRCGLVTPVYCLASNGFAELEYVDDCDEPITVNIDGFTTFSDVTYAPSEVEEFLKSHYPTYFKDFSKTASGTYFMNHCTCGAKLGDHFMHTNGGAFMPTEPELAKAVKLVNTRLNLGAEIGLAASPGRCVPSYIEMYAKRS